MSLKRRTDLNSIPISFPEILRQRKNSFLEDKYKLQNLIARKKVRSLQRSNASQLPSGRRVKTDLIQAQDNILSQNLSVAAHPVRSQSIWSDPKYQQSQNNSFVLGINESENPQKKAKNLIKRLRKLKQYNQGRFFMVRKKQQQKKMYCQQKRERQKQERLMKYRLYKEEKSRKNIIIHQSRIEQRQIQIEKRASKQRQNQCVLAPPFNTQQLSLSELQKRLQRISVRLRKRFP